MRPRYRAIIARAVEEGAQAGTRRAFKHSDNPSEEAISDAVEMAIMGALYDVLSFDDEEE